MSIYLKIGTWLKNNRDINQFLDLDKHIIKIAKTILSNNGGGSNSTHSSLVLDDGTNPHNTSQIDIGLPNVNNTSDLNKPISTATQTVLNNKADLVAGVIPTSQLPSIAITDFLGDVNSSTQMLALIGQKGDWCIRTDVNRTYFIVEEPSNILNNWRFIETSGVSVISVNNQVGVVVLSKNDLNLNNIDNTSDLNKPVSTATEIQLNLKENINNKTVDFSIINNNLYPSIQAVQIELNKGYNDSIINALIFG